MSEKKSKKIELNAVNLRKIVDFTFVVVISLYMGFAVFKLSNPSLWEKKVTRVPGPMMSTPSTKLPPTEVKIDIIKIDLPVAAGLVDGNTWDLYDDKIAWLATSAVPGEGNVILYGHDRRGLFGDLYKLQPGDTISVKVGGLWVNYKVTELHRVLPTDVNSIISNQNRLTMYTCDGTFDQKRLVVYADPS